MREVNFSIPNANKASVGITTALYDRRALDCTSTLPLINSLNNLAYLTTSSPRIRDILTVDGGIERLVCILKDGRRTKDMMECWKWNLAFQCVVNIGVRGSEAVRTRVVEADMVPVIATILDNYVRVVDKCREKADAEYKRGVKQLGPAAKHQSRASDLLLSGHHGLDRIRRQAPPPIEIPSPAGAASRSNARSDAAHNLPAFSLSSPPERTTFSRGHHHHRSHDSRTAVYPPNTSRPAIPQPLMTSVPTMDGASESFGIRPVRDVDRLPSMLPALHLEPASQPVSPTTPNAPINPLSQPARGPIGAGRPNRRPSIRHQLSVSGVSDDGPSADEAAPGSGSATAGPAGEPVVGIETDIRMQDIVDTESMLDEEGSPVQLDPPAPDTVEETFNMARSVLEGSAINPTIAPAPANMNVSPIQAFTTLNHGPQMQLNPYTRHLQERNASIGVISSMPRDEDVLMCLQLLAYVSKYCNLRSYFQQSHLVPKLKIPKSELALLDGDASPSMMVEDEDLVEEYLQPDDFNIFPLVEKFTVRHHTPDMQYWAGVVMRNLCRKDDARGGIRQCAYYLCGRWEEYTRQFAKCRRCRRTKYCSKECQKAAWIYHRHWCSEAQK